MKPFTLCLLVALILAGCDKKEKEESEDGDADTKKVARVTPKPTPKPGDWMWQNADGKKDAKYVSPLGSPSSLNGPHGLNKPKK